MTTADADSARPAGTRSSATASRDAHGDDLPRPSASGARTTGGAGATGPEQANPRGCPFLVAESGGWRLAMPSRDHRCGAFSPPAPLSPEKQARLCLTPAHTTCATYLASISARTERLGAAPVRRTTRWGLARTTSVIEDPGGLRARLVGALLDRRRWPAIPAVILVTTLFVLALSGLRAGVPVTPVATSGSTPRATVTATRPATTPERTSAPTSVPTPSPQPSPTVQVTPPPTSKPSKPPATSKPIASYRTYRVKPGDTLSAIAAKYGTTVSAIASLNHLSDPGALSVGQVLLIP